MYVHPHTVEHIKESQNIAGIASYWKTQILVYSGSQ